MQAEFIEGNFGPHKLDLKIEEKLGVVPPELSKTSKMNDPPPPRNLKSDEPDASEMNAVNINNRMSRRKSEGAGDSDDVGGERRARQNENIRKKARACAHVKTFVVSLVPRE